MDTVDFFKNIKSRLGHPFHNIEIHQDQLDICLHDALDFFLEYSYEGVKPFTMILNIVAGQREYVLPANVYSVIEAVSIQSAYGTPTFRRVIAEHLLYTSPYLDIMDYALYNSYHNDVSSLTNPQYSFHFNRHTHTLTLYTQPEAEQLAFKIYIDEKVASLESLLEDRWLQKYTAALTKYQWSTNISKYDKDIVGGGKVNYERIGELAEKEKERLEEELFSRKAEPIEFFVA